MLTERDQLAERLVKVGHVELPETVLRLRGFDRGTCRREGVLVNGSREPDGYAPRTSHPPLDLVHTSARNDAATYQDRHVVSQFLCLKEVVGGEQYGGSVVDDLANKPAQGLGARHVETRGRLVQKQDLRAMHQGGPDGKAALHAARKRPERCVGFLRQFETTQQLFRALFPLPTGKAIKLTQVFEVPAAAEFGVEVGILGHDADARLHVDRIAGHVPAEDGDLAAVALQQPAQDVDGRGLARAIGPEIREDAAFRYVERHPVQCDEGVVALFQAADANGYLRFLVGLAHG